MTPGELESIRAYVAKHDPDDTQWYIARDLLAEVDRLKAERPELYESGWRDGHRAAPWEPDMTKRLRETISEVLADRLHALLPSDSDRATQIALHVSQRWPYIVTGKDEQ